MRILLMSGVTSYMKGGVPIATARLAHGLLEAGHEPVLLADVALPGAENVPLYHLDYPQNEKMHEQIRAAVDSFSPDACHLVSAGVKMTDAVASVLADHPWAMTIHSIPPAERKFEHAHGNDYLHYICRNLRYLPNTKLWRQMLSRGQFTRAICHSDFVLNTAVRYGCRPDKLINIPLAVELPPAKDRMPKAFSPESGPKIVTVGGIAHTKGLHDFLMALPAIRQTYPNAHYQLIGEVRDQSYLRYLRILVARLSLNDAVTITIAASETEKAAALAEADLYVQPSHEEGFCLAYIEAAPLVPRLLGTDTGAIAAISKGLPSAAVVQCKDVSALAISSLQLLNDPVAPDVFSRRHAQLHEKYSPQAYVQAHLRLYESLGKTALKRAENIGSLTSDSVPTSV
jgi:glycosyltransferase involved in cell wall biosynthesis